MRATAIPYGAYWSTPFAKWQGALSHLHSLLFAAHVARDALARRGIDPAIFDGGVLGTTVPQRGAFYGLPWLMGELGAPQAHGPTINQACATGVRSLATAAADIAGGACDTMLVTCADRVSNGPMIYYPDPSGPGGHGVHEDWVLDNFARDPFAKLAMVETAENVARKYQIGTAEQNEVTLLRYDQYADAVANDRAFQRRYMDLPFNVPDAKFRRVAATMAGDEGVHDTQAEGLAKLRPVIDGGHRHLWRADPSGRWQRRHRHDHAGAGEGPATRPDRHYRAGLRRGPGGQGLHARIPDPRDASGACRQPGWASTTSMP